MVRSKRVYALICCFLVGKAAPGANINIQVNIEQGEREIAAALVLVATLFIWLSCRSVRVMSLYAVQCFVCVILVTLLLLSYIWYL